MKSICRKVCEYEEDGQGSYRSNEEKTCRGCGRTASEIEEWLYASDERKKQIAKTARERQRAIREKNG